jgi:hypothetical protein
MRCHEHPRYRGNNPPKSDCIICWKLYSAILEDTIEKMDGIKSVKAEKSMKKKTVTKALSATKEEKDKILDDFRKE